MEVPCHFLWEGLCEHQGFPSIDSRGSCSFLCVAHGPSLACGLISEAYIVGVLDLIFTPLTSKDGILEFCISFIKPTNLHMFVKMMDALYRSRLEARNGGTCLSPQHLKG